VVAAYSQWLSSQTLVASRYSWGLAIIWAAIFLAGAAKEVYNSRAARGKVQSQGLAYKEDASGSRDNNGQGKSIRWSESCA
jgi:hypothetical protein